MILHGTILSSMVLHDTILSSMILHDITLSSDTITLCSMILLFITKYDFV